MASAALRSNIDSLLTVAPIVFGVFFCVKSLLNYTVLSVLSSFSTILLRKRDSVAIL